MLEAGYPPNKIVDESNSMHGENLQLSSQLATMNVFAPRVVEQIGSYVYLLIDPRDETIFYVGKGTGNRCFAHLAEARTTQSDTVGDYPKLTQIRDIEAAGEQVLIDLLRHGLSEDEAFLVESVAIDLAGAQSLTNRVVGHNAIELGRMSVMDINAQYGATPVEIDPAHRVVLIRINRLFKRGMSDDDLYEATRRWWKVGLQRRQIGTPEAPMWALAIYHGVVRSVYRINAWEPSPDEGSGRWGFCGTRDLAMENLYLLRDVSSHLRALNGHPSQNPMRYINCG